MTKATINNKMS